MDSILPFDVPMDTLKILHTTHLVVTVLETHVHQAHLGAIRCPHTFEPRVYAKDLKKKKKRLGF